MTPELLSGAVCSTVNLAEVQSKLVTNGWSVEDAWADATGVTERTVSFTDDQAKIAGSMISVTRPLGLSLGDRACLALAISLGAPVYTAERLWAKLKLGPRIHVIR
jgi:PIN domain nuclease of toxin-antitoxin system